jgi:hypothetical protein
MSNASRSPKTVVEKPRGMNHSAAPTAMVSAVIPAKPSFCEYDIRLVSVWVERGPVKITAENA